MKTLLMCLVMCWTGRGGEEEMEEVIDMAGVVARLPRDTTSKYSKLIIISPILRKHIILVHVLQTTCNNTNNKQAYDCSAV
jgi:hypothetical protein